MRTGHVARMDDGRNSYKNFVGNAIDIYEIFGFHCGEILYCDLG
jgi:hypothetical protein